MTSSSSTAAQSIVRVGVTVGPHIKKVDTYRVGSGQGVVRQAHRGYRGWVHIPGTREPVACCDHHQKQGAAREHALRVGRAIAKERGLLPPLDPNAKRAR